MLLCLFDDEITDGEITKVKIHQKVETLHFGFDESKDKLVKTLRSDKQVTSEFKDPKDKRIVDIDRLLQAMGASATFSSAEFAFEMIEGVEEVTFLITPPA